MKADKEAMLKALIAVAWADGKLADEEQEVIDALIDAFEVTGDEADEVRAYAKVRRTLDDIPLSDLNRADRMTLLQHAVVVSYADGEQDAAEAQMIRDLIERTNISKGDASAVIEAAEMRARRLLELL